MATEVKKAPEQKATEKSSEERVVASAQQFWSKSGKFVVYGLTIGILVAAGFFIYKSYFVAPEEEKAAEAMWKAQQYFQADSFRLALNGDGANQGFLRVTSKFGSTKSGNLAKFYAGVCYLQLGDFNNAVKYLKDFSTDQKIIKLQATGLLGDAYSELGKKQEAVDHYKKAGTMYPDDEVHSPEYLFRAAMMYQELGKNQEAIDLLHSIKDKYPTSPRNADVEKYLGKLGDTK